MIHKSFKYLPIRRKTFVEIAEQIGRSGAFKYYFNSIQFGLTTICFILADECSKKWRNLRDLHVKRLKAGVEYLFEKGDERERGSYFS